MIDCRKSKKQLMEELEELRQQVIELKNGSVEKSNSDITECKLAERQLAKSEESYREFIEGTDNLVTQADDKGIFTFVNHASERIFSLSPEACIGRSAFDFIHPDDRERTIRIFNDRVSNEARSITFKNRQRHRSGSSKTILWNLNLHYDDEGNIAYINGIARDVTERKQLERQLEQTHEKFLTEQVVLREKNIALKEVMGQIEEEKVRMKIRIQANIEKIIGPILRSLQILATAEQKKYMDELESSLNDIASPFINNLKNAFSQLSPRELEVCNMIKNGLSSKDIASALNVSVYTVHNQRRSIRKKLGIADNITNLTSFLHSN